MSLTKEECVQKAKDMAKIMPLKSEYGYGCSDEEFDETQEFIFQLIEKCFDNPPLKFEELHEGMWVWCETISPNISMYKGWCLIDHIENNKVLCHGVDGKYEFQYKENHFYRKQVD